MDASQANTLHRPVSIWRIIIAAVLGEVALVILTTVAQEVLFNGIDYNTSPIFDILFGGLATFVAAILAGFIASYLVKGRSMVPHWIISVLILIEMTYLILSGVLTGPLWFEILSGLSLVVGILIGYSAYRGFRAAA